MKKFFSFFSVLGGVAELCGGIMIFLLSPFADETAGGVLSFMYKGRF